MSEQEAPDGTFQSSQRAKTVNLAPGPSPLPFDILQDAALALLDYNNTGIGILEHSHRGREFTEIIKNACRDVRKLLDVPDNYKILWMQGGGTGQFAAVVQNLLAWYALKNPNLDKEDKLNPPVDYLVTGAWSKKAAEEASRLGANVNVAVDGKSNGYTSIPETSTWKLTNGGTKPAFVYYCDNETIHGLEYQPSFPYDVLPDPSVPLVSDMSSNIFTRKVDVSKHGVIFAGAQKNFGPSGITLVIIRDDLLVDPDLATRQHSTHPIPSSLSYHLHATSSSLHNTPPTFAIYICSTTCSRLLSLGGTEAMSKFSQQKADSVYKTIDESEGFYVPKVGKDRGRSRVNIVFEVSGGKDREERFFADADGAGLKQIKGHRSVGGVRVSLYNAVTLEQTDVLVGFMKSFRQKELEIQMYS